MILDIHCYRTENSCACVYHRELHACVCLISNTCTSFISISACVSVCPFPFTAVISAHPIHSLDNHHHYYHMGSLAAPTRSYLYHQGGGHPRPHACATPVSHLERVESTGETLLPPAGRAAAARVPPLARRPLVGFFPSC